MVEEPDLFDETESRGPWERVKSFLRSGSEVSLHLSLEKLIVTGAIVTVLMVVIYILGFMQGRMWLENWKGAEQVVIPAPSFPGPAGPAPRSTGRARRGANPPVVQVIGSEKSSRLDETFYSEDVG